MKKLMAILVFAGVLSVPSAVFAEASWYGSLRIGLQSSGGDTSVTDATAGSRWGVTGSTEAGEGLTAVYQLEAAVGAENASFNTAGRLSYVGLSGGFGSVTLGQIWGASFNSFGAITDNSNIFGNAETTYRHGNVVSYAFSNDAFSLQADLAFAEPNPTPAAIAMVTTGAYRTVANNDPMEDLEQAEFGLSINIGEIGKFAVAYIDDKYVRLEHPGADSSYTAADDNFFSTWRIKSTYAAFEMTVGGMTAYVGAGNQKFDNTSRAGTNTNDDGTPNATDDELAQALDPDKEKTTFFGVRGSLGDTGLGYVFQWRDKKPTDGVSMDHSPWILALNKDLGGGARVSLEHSNTDDGPLGTSNNATRLALRIDF